MKHFLRVLWIVAFLASIQAFGDSVNNFKNLNVSFGITPNQGFGNNIGGNIYGAGVNILAFGGTPYEWFNDDQGFVPGTPGGGDTNIFFDTAFGSIGSQYYDDLSIGEATFNAGSFTFPTNGKGFTITVPASIGVITLTGCNDSGCDTFNLTTKPGNLTLSFFYSSYTGLYFGDAGSFVTTPEPSTLGLVALGLGAAVWRKKTLGT